MLLLLAGTAQAREIAEELARRQLPAVASLSGATRNPAPMAIETRVGGFGGAEGFEAFLNERAITAILDATHPFATRITARTARIAAERALPYLHLQRPAWEPGPGDNWISITREEEAVHHIPSGATVFLATGRQNLNRFQNLVGRRLICRRIDAAENPFPFEGGEYLLGRGPFSVAEEVALFRQLGVDFLIVKNAGGAASAPKLVAARQLAIPVVMIERAPMPEVARVSDVESALDWVAGLTW